MATLAVTRRFDLTDAQWVLLEPLLPGQEAGADAAGVITWDVSVDSTITRAHQHAAGARGGEQRESAGGIVTEPADHALDRSRGGWTTKLHLACDQGQRPLAMVLTAGHRGDSPQVTTILATIRVPRAAGGRPRTRPDLVLADRAYTSRANRAYLRRRGIKACIPSKTDQDAHRRAKGSEVVGHPHSTRTSTGNATPSSAASTGSNATEL